MTPTLPDASHNQPESSAMVSYDLVSVIISVVIAYQWMVDYQGAMRSSSNVTDVTAQPSSSSWFTTSHYSQHTLMEQLESDSDVGGSTSQWNWNTAVSERCLPIINSLKVDEAYP